MLSSIFKFPRSFRIPTKNGTIGIQRVRILRLKSPTSFMLFAPLLTYTIIQTSEYWLPTEFRKTLNALNHDFEKAKKDVASRSNQKQFGEHWKREHERAAKAESTAVGERLDQSETDKPPELFIKIPIWTRQKILPPYLPPDPEWKEFQKLQADEKRVQDLFRSVAKMTFDKFVRGKKNGRHLHFIGWNNSLGIDLDVLVPLHPPTAYEIPGLSISPGSVKWSWQMLPESYGSKLQRVLHPSIFAQSFWVGLKVFFQLSYESSKTYVQSAASSTPSAIIEGTRRSRSALKAKPDSASESIDLSVHEKESKDLASKKKGPISDLSSILPINGASMMETHKSVVSSVTSETAPNQAILAFQAKFLQLQIGAWHELPRGACMIEGFVDFWGTRGKIRNHVFVIYLPGEDRFIGDAVIESSKIFPHSPAWTEDMMKAKEEAQKRQLPPELTGGAKEAEQKKGEEKRGA